MSGTSISGMPATLTSLPGAASAAHTLIYDNPTAGGLVGTDISFSLQLRDSFENFVSQPPPPPLSSTILDQLLLVVTCLPPPWGACVRHWCIVVYSVRCSVRCSVLQAVVHSVRCSVCCSVCCSVL